MGAEDAEAREDVELLEEAVVREELELLGEAVLPEAIVVPRVPCMMLVTPGEVVGSRRVATELVKVPLSLMIMFGAPEEVLASSAEDPPKSVPKTLSVKGSLPPKGSPPVQSKSVHRSVVVQRIVSRILSNTHFVALQWERA